MSSFLITAINEIKEIRLRVKPDLLYFIYSGYFISSTLTPILVLTLTSFSGDSIKVFVSTSDLTRNPFLYSKEVEPVAEIFCVTPG